MGGTYERAGKTILPDWWTDKVFPMLDSGDYDYSDLAAKASKIVGRTSPWRGDAITKFKQGGARTRELAIALSTVLKVPSPFFDAATEAEAKAIQSVIDAIRGQQPTTPVTPAVVSRESAVFQKLDEVVVGAKDQTKPLRSKNEGSPRGLGHRRASTRR